MQQSDESIKPFEAMYDMIVAAYSKQSNWEAIERVERIRNPNLILSVSAKDQYSFQHWEGLKKVGNGKEAHWEVATYVPLNITVGVQPNRNPAKNGIQLLFYENYCEDGRWERRKLGFLLMKNSNNHSSLLGMFLEGQRRGKGVAKVCLAMWQWFCLKASVTPTTGVINKPLLSLLLQYRFGFVPRKGGVVVELTQDADNPEALLLYAPSRKSLRGSFSPWDLQNQNIRLLEFRPETPGRTIDVRTSFDAPDRVKLKELVEDILPDGSVECNMTSQDIRRLYFGKE
jgi:hypothetical protein